MRTDVRASVAKALLVGLVLREALSFWTGHPFDTEIWLRNAYYVAHGWNPYMDMPPVPGASFAYTGSLLPSVAYLPLWSLVLAGLYRVYAVLPGLGRFFLYFLVKQPPVLGDVGLGYALYVAALRWGGSTATARRILRFWMVFPYPILISAVWGQFDALVATLVLLSLLAAAAWARSSLLGLGILLKLFPVILLPYEVLRCKGRERWATLLALAIPAGFTAAVFAVTGWSLSGLTSTMTYETSGSIQGMTYFRVLTDAALLPHAVFGSPDFVLLGYLWIPGVILGAIWARRRFPGDGPMDLVQSAIFLTVVLFLMRWTVNEQYLMYLLPLLLLDVELWHRERRSLFRATWIVGLGFLFLNNFFLVRFGAPVFPGALAFEASLQAVPGFAAARSLLLDAFGLLFSIDLLQVAAVVAKPTRSTTPWVVVALRRTWMSSVRRVRALTAGRGG